MKIQKINLKQWKSKAFFLAKTLQQAVTLGDRLLKNQVIIIPSNTIFDANTTDVQETIFVFTNVKQGSYDLIVRHHSDSLHAKRKMAWAVFELNGLPTNARVANKSSLALGDSGMFSYIGGGRARDGVYHSGTAINAYKNCDFITVKIVSSSTDRLNIKQIGLVEKNQDANKGLIADKLSGENHNIDLSSLFKRLRPTFNENIYIIYANISPNIVDGSSIWLSSIVDIVANNSHVVLLLNQDIKNNLIVSNIKNSDKVTILQPSDYSNIDILTESHAMDIVKIIDGIHPRLCGVLVRGMNAARELTLTRQFKYRSICYVTDFYKVGDCQIEIDESNKAIFKQIALHTELLLIQTPEMKKQIVALLGYNHKNFAYLPPSLPDSIFLEQGVKAKSNDEMLEIKIGYAGKIMPNWGIEELLSWVIDFNNENNKVKIKVFLAANKITAPSELRKPFVTKIRSLIQKSNAEHYTDFNREKCIEMLSKMDYVWAYRPGSFENYTLELSTKLLEAIAVQQKVICFPSTIHKNELGETYPLYVRDQSDFRRIMEKPLKALDLSEVSAKLKTKNSISAVSERIKNFKPFNIHARNMPCICFASHDFKFIDAYVSYLKSQGRPVLRDNWDWGGCKNLEITKNNYERADIIFCEWGLANAVWFSKNNKDNKPIYIRVHAQEVRDRAKKFGNQIDFSQITKVIFVSKAIRDKYIELFKIPIEKTIVIPNFVFDDEYTLAQRITNESKVVLGMVGMVPQLKRIDRAVKVLEQLISEGLNVELRIKGHRPENLDFMKAPGRAAELEYYDKVYNYIKDKGLSDRVFFDEWGNDVALWYKNIDFILSPSDTESFHYALADGVLSGCIPVVWNWNEAKTVYHIAWVVNSNEEAVNYIKQFVAQNDVLLKDKNRQLIKDRYGFLKIAEKLSELIFDEKLVDYEKKYST